jgi:hypothetical protein
MGSWGHNSMTFAYVCPYRTWLAHPRHFKMDHVVSSSSGNQNSRSIEKPTEIGHFWYPTWANPHMTSFRVSGSADDNFLRVHRELRNAFGFRGPRFFFSRVPGGMVFLGWQLVDIFFLLLVINGNFRILKRRYVSNYFWPYFLGIFPEM